MQLELQLHLGEECRTSTTFNIFPAVWVVDKALWKLSCLLLSFWVTVGWRVMSVVSLAFTKVSSREMTTGHAPVLIFGEVYFYLLYTFVWIVYSSSVRCIELCTYSVVTCFDIVCAHLLFQLPHATHSP